MKRRELICLLLTTVVLGTGSAYAADVSGQDYLKQFAKETTSAQGEFTQTILDKSGKALEAPVTGNFAFKRPGQFVWRIEKPYPQSIISDGATLWIWDPDLNQVTVKKLTAAVSTTPAAVLFGKGNIEDVFELKDLSDEGGRLWVRATPKIEDMSYASIQIAFDKKGNLAGMRLNDHFGQTTRIEFSKVQTGTMTDDSAFSFSIPEGADVLRDDN